jgi:hypothetical protein
MASWRFNYTCVPEAPPLAWVAMVRKGLVQVLHGPSVRVCEEGFAEGTWVGDGDIRAITKSTTVFGSGLALDAGELVVVPPSHPMEGVYTVNTSDACVVSNSLVAALEATGLRLTNGVDYATLISGISDGIGMSPIDIPASNGFAELHFYENLRIERDGTLRRLAKPREEPFADYHDYVRRLEGALASALRNAAGYKPVVALSSGYDSTAVAVLAARNGCRRAITFDGGRPRAGESADADSGAPTAKRLGMEVETFERLEYLGRNDLPEAEFLATGATGEDVAMLAFEPALRRAVLLNGMVGGAMWRRRRARRSDLWRPDLSGCSLTEYRLRVDFAYVPVPVFAMSQQPSIQDISVDAAMSGYSVGGAYDEPIPRRIAEDAGLPRGTFATSKRAGTALLHLDGPAAMARPSVEAVRHFAAQNGIPFVLRARSPLGRRHRALIRLGALLRVPALAEAFLRRRRTLVQFEPAAGSLLFRWAVDVVRPRYAALTARAHDAIASGSQEV